MHSYYELPDEERPDENIWHHPQRLQEWFEAVKAKRKDPKGEAVPQAEEPEGGWMRNELLAEHLGEDYRK